MTAQFSVDGLLATPVVTAALARDAISTPTPVQTAAIAPILAGRDILVQSGTGTGKTLAYLLPLLQRAAADATLRVVVMAPSPELAVQILRVVEAYSAPHVTSVGLVGGGNIERQKDKLKKHPQVLVGTPGRVLELIFMRKIKTALIGALVLDEIDAILSAKNEEDLQEICSRPEFKAQIICASATFGVRAQAFAKRFMRLDHDAIKVAQSRTLNPLITHHVLHHDPQHGQKDAVLADFIVQQGIQRAIIFVNKLYAVTHLYGYLNERGIPSVGLSGERNKQERQKALTRLKDGSVQIVIATDTAARGLDIKDLGWVIHYEAAHDAETYLHRAGRVGRARRGGSLVGIGGTAGYISSQALRCVFGYRFQ